MRVLILSNYPWKKNNSFGNTYSSFFGNIPNIEIAHVYLFDGLPDLVPNVSCYYQILERDVMKSVFFRGKRVGRGLSRSDIDSYKQNDSINNKHRTFYSRFLSFGRRHHWHVLFWVRELAWKFGRINYGGLLDFVKDFNPDVFFLPFSNVFYTNRLALFIKSHYDCPMVMEMAMDHYTFHRVSINPFFWLDRIAKRKMIRKMVKQSEMMFVISDRLKRELEKDLSIACRVLYKTPDTSRSLELYNGCIGTMKFLFTGNIYSNRWKSLAMLARQLKHLHFGHLDVYTASPITHRIQRALNIEGYSEVHPPVSQEDVIRLQNEADVLVHSESFDLFNKSIVKCAISTKIMDYLSVGRCILAIGPSDISSIEYLKEHNVALIASSKDEINHVLTLIQSNEQLVSDYAKRALEYSRKHLNADEMGLSLYEDLKKVITDYRMRRSSISN